MYLTGGYLSSEMYPLRERREKWHVDPQDAAWGLNRNAYTAGVGGGGVLGAKTRGALRRGPIKGALLRISASLRGDFLGIFINMRGAGNACGGRKCRKS